MVHVIPIQKPLETRKEDQWEGHFLRHKDCQPWTQGQLFSIRTEKPTSRRNIKQVGQNRSQYFWATFNYKVRNAIIPCGEYRLQISDATANLELSDNNKNDKCEQSASVTLSVMANAEAKQESACSAKKLQIYSCGKYIVPVF